MARLATALVCLAIAAPAFAQEAPIATTRDPAKAPAPAAPVAPPAVSPLSSSSAPADDYGYVAWCYGAVSGYVDQYPVAMPEVIRIERAFPTPSTEENIAKIYPQQRDAAKASLPLYRAALTATEKASARPISAYGVQAVAKGRSVWNGYAAANKARLGQFWMGWAAPADCDTRAKALKAKSDLMGQALSFNAPSAVDEPATAASAETPAPVETPAAEATAAPTSIDDLLAPGDTVQPAPAKVAQNTPRKALARPAVKAAPKLRGSQ